MKILKKVLIIAVIVIVVGVLMVYFAMNSIVRRAIETGAGNALGTKTSLGSAAVHPFAGKVTLVSLEIANPEGFQTGEFLTMKKGAVDVAMGSLLSDPVVVEEISIESPVLTIERKDLTTNLNVILDNLSKNAKGTETKEKETGKGKGFKIKHLLVKDAKAKFLLVGQEPVTIELGDIEMKDLGTGEDNGIKMGVVTLVILTRLAQEVVVDSAGQIPADVLKGMDSAVKDASKAAGEIAGALQKTLDETLKALPDVTKDLPKLPGLGGDK